MAAEASPTPPSPSIRRNISFTDLQFPDMSTVQVGSTEKQNSVVPSPSDSKFPGYPPLSSSPDTPSAPEPAGLGLTTSQNETPESDSTGPGSLLPTTEFCFHSSNEGSNFPSGFGGSNPNSPPDSPIQRTLFSCYSPTLKTQGDAGLEGTVIRSPQLWPRPGSNNLPAPQPTSLSVPAPSPSSLVSPSPPSTHSYSIQGFPLPALPVSSPTPFSFAPHPSMDAAPTPGPTSPMRHYMSSPVMASNTRQPQFHPAPIPASPNPSMAIQNQAHLQHSPAMFNQMVPALPAPMPSPNATFPFACPPFLLHPHSLCSPMGVQGHQPCLPSPSPLSFPMHCLPQMYTILGDVIGQGRFGVVTRAVDRRTGEVVACKRVSKARLAHDAAGGESPEKLLRNEVGAMERLRHAGGHRNVVLLRAKFEDKHSLCLVMDLCEAGELYSEIIRRWAAGDPFTPFEAARMFYQIVSGVAFSHAASVVHRDLKPENILLTLPQTQTSLFAAPPPSPAIKAALGCASPMSMRSLGYAVSPSPARDFRPSGHLPPFSPSRVCSHSPKAAPSPGWQEDRRVRASLPFSPQGGQGSSGKAHQGLPDGSTEGDLVREPSQKDNPAAPLSLGAPGDTSQTTGGKAGREHLTQPKASIGESAGAPGDSPNPSDIVQARSRNSGSPGLNPGITSGKRGRPVASPSPRQGVSRASHGRLRAGEEGSPLSWGSVAKRSRLGRKEEGPSDQGQGAGGAGGGGEGQRGESKERTRVSREVKEEDKGKSVDRADGAKGGEGDEGSTATGSEGQQGKEAGSRQVKRRLLQDGGAGEGAAGEGKRQRLGGERSEGKGTCSSPSLLKGSSEGTQNKLDLEKESWCLSPPQPRTHPDPASPPPRPEYLLKLADFGLSLVVDPQGKARGVAGSPGYMAPETQQLEEYDSSKADVWSLGVILYILLCGRHPFPEAVAEGGEGVLRRGGEGGEGEGALKGSEGGGTKGGYRVVGVEFDGSGYPLLQWPGEDQVNSAPNSGGHNRGGIPEAAKGLVRSMLHSLPSKRPTARKILTHPWLLQCVYGGMVVRRKGLSPLAQNQSPGKGSLVKPKAVPVAGGVQLKSQGSLGHVVLSTPTAKQTMFQKEQIPSSPWSPAALGLKKWISMGTQATERECPSQSSHQPSPSKPHTGVKLIRLSPFAKGQ